MKKTLGCIVLVLVLSVFGSAQTAAAFEKNARKSRVSRAPQHVSGRESRSRSREDHGRREVRFHQPIHYERRLPAGYRTLRITNRILYYLNGIFYQSTPYGYQVVNAPVGAIVRELPLGYYQIFHRGATYYVYNNTCYVRGPQGYNIVTPPVVLFPVQTGW